MPNRTREVDAASERYGLSVLRPLTASILAIAVVIAGCGADTETETEAAQAVELERCGEIPRAEGFRCGELEVPFERADPSYGTTQSPSRFASATGPRSRRWERFSLTRAAPGSASTGTANTYSKLFGPLLNRRDLVVVDQRGTGLSDRYDCPDLQKGRGPEFLTLSTCARRLGKRFISYRSSAGADDVNDIREALGLDKIVLYGDSYGTFLAQSYAFRHPETLQAMVLDSAYPARGESPWYGSLIRTGNRVLELACRRAPKCDGDAGARLEELVSHLRETGRGVGSLLDAFSGATYGTPHSYVELDHAGAALVDGRPKQWDELTAAPPKASSGDARGYVRAGELAVGCNDYPMIWDKQADEPERRRQLEQAIRDHPNNFGPFKPREIALDPDFGYLECLTWPKPTEVYEPPISPGDDPTTAPVLVISGEMDNLTTPQEGKNVADEFPNSRQYITRNAGHVNATYYRSGDGAEQVRRFIRKHTSGG